MGQPPQAGAGQFQPFQDLPDPFPWSGPGIPSSGTASDAAVRLQQRSGSPMICSTVNSGFTAR